MMRKTSRFTGVSTLSALALAAGLTFYSLPGEAVSSTSGLPARQDRADPVPQRFQIAQAQSGGQNVVGASLPGGASSLNETYKDWRVGCAQQGNLKRCVVSQVQAQQSGQRVLAIELNAPSGNAISGTLVMPFGLALESGVGFQVDDRPAIQPTRFRTCMPGGCLVSVSFDTPTLVALRAGTVLKIKAVADGGAAAPFSISLQGLATALDRVGALSR